MTQQEIEQRFERIEANLETVTNELSQVSQKLNQTAAIQDANAEQIAANTAGMTELRLLLSTYLQGRSQL
jgi:archaellum component FlaC